MKSFIMLIAMALVLIVPTKAGNKAEEASIRQVLSLYKDSGDKQDPQLADKALHREFALYYIGPKGLTKSTLDEYKQALQAKKIGGDTRSMTLEHLEAKDNVAGAAITLRGRQATFTQFVNLVKENGAWKIINVVLKFEPRGK